MDDASFKSFYLKPVYDDPGVVREILNVGDKKLNTTIPVCEH